MCHGFGQSGHLIVNSKPSIVNFCDMDKGGNMRMGGRLALVALVGVIALCFAFVALLLCLQTLASAQAVVIYVFSGLFALYCFFLAFTWCLDDVPY
jgi:uncharacterized membrane protein YuzA (DUF378 family)